jgi:streptogramin lyase
LITLGPEGDLWFTGGLASTIGEINPVTHAASDFPTPTREHFPEGITAGPDGNVWFTESSMGRIGEIGTGTPPALTAASVVVGGGQAGVAQVCAGAQWSNFAFQQPASDLFSFDGFQWLLNGSLIPGQTTDSYTPRPVKTETRSHARRRSRTLSPT